MLKPVAAGLMCLGFVTLGVAMSRGDDETDLIVIEGRIDAKEVPIDEAKPQPPAGISFTTDGGVAGISIVGSGGEAGVSVDGKRFKIVTDEKGVVFVYNEDGKIIEKHDAGATPGKISSRFTRLAQAQPVVDPQTREALEKMTAALKDQIQKLQSEGKQDEAQQKAASLGAIEGLLRGNARFLTLKMGDPKERAAEIKKLHDRMQELVAEGSKLPEGATAEREKIKQEITRLKKEIAERHQPMVITGAGGSQAGFGLGQPFAPGFPGQPGAQFGGGGFGFVAGQQAGPGSSAGMKLLRKSEALSQAAAQLKSNGLDEQAQPLQAKAEQLRAEAQKMMQEEAEKQRAQMQAQPGGFPGGFGGGAGGFHAFGGFPGGQPQELHKSIHELQEQIQQLRKEVGELRELLQRKQ